MLAKGGNAGGADEFFDEVRTRRLPIQLVPATDSCVGRAARVKARYSISYADAFAAALAHETGRPLLTGDPEFQPLARDGICEIAWLS